MTTVNHVIFVIEKEANTSLFYFSRGSFVVNKENLAYLAGKLMDKFSWTVKMLVLIVYSLGCLSTALSA